LNPILRGLTESQASTDPTSDDRRLIGRTYAIPFEDVWQASVALCDGVLRGWSILSSDDQRGVIEAVARSSLLRVDDDVRIAIQLDENAQTRVDVWSGSRRNRGTLGRNRRLVGRFFRRLDRQLQAGPNKILDPTTLPEWHETR
jgi:hypothetical protein